MRLGSRMYCCTQFFQKLLGNVHIGLPAGKCRIFRSVRDENRVVSNSSMTSRSCADQAAAGTNPTSIHASSQDQSLGDSGSGKWDARGLGQARKGAFRYRLSLYGRAAARSRAIETRPQLSFVLPCHSWASLPQRTPCFTNTRSYTVHTLFSWSSHPSATTGSGGRKV
ncbi:hypothetical protein MRX96_041183 [Rhipicephalus microplus]